MFIKLIILVVILACVAPFFIKGPGGQPLMTLDDWIPGDQPGLPSVLAPGLTTGRANSGPPEPVTVYKWQDENGVWQFSNDPADAGTAETMELDGNINIIPAVPVDTTPASPTQPATATGAIAAIPPGMTSVSPEKIQQMMDTVNNLQETVDQRKSDMDKAIRQQ